MAQYITYTFIRNCFSDGSHIKVRAQQLYLGPDPDDARVYARVHIISHLGNEVSASFSTITTEEYQDFIEGPYDEVCYYIDSSGHEVWIARRKGSP